MQGRALSWVVVGLLLAGVRAADDPDPTKLVAAEEEAKRLEGTWEVVYYEASGMTLPEAIGTQVDFSRCRIRMEDED